MSEHYKYEDKYDWITKSDYSEWVDEINDLRGSFYRASKRVQFQQQKIDRLEKENELLKAELKKERECVDFYANEENWEDCWIDGCAGSEDYFTSIKDDMDSRVGGYRANQRQKERREV